MRSILVVAAITCVLVDGVPDCSVHDYNGVALMNLTAMAQCFTIDHPGQWYECIDSLQLAISLDCAGTIGDDVGAMELDLCYDRCFGHPANTDCRLCIGVVSARAFMLHAPTMTGPCGGEGDRERISGVCETQIINASDIHSLPAVADVSDSCSSCLSSHAVNCASMCEVRDAACLDCETIDFVSAIAYCNAGVVLPVVNCSIADYTGLDKMNPAVVTTCVEAAEGDGFIECFGNPDTVNMNSGCSIGLDAHMSYRIVDLCEDTVCASKSISAHCLNCQGSVIVQEIFEHAPNGTGACGGTDNLAAIAAVDMQAVIACGADQAITGATCLAFQAEASKLCINCLDERTKRAIEQCKPHCADDQSGPNCMSCINIGLMSAAAHCNAHMSGSVGFMNVSLLSLVAIIWISLIA